MLDFRMETFLAVCQCMNFTRASEQLNITQPAVSQHIRFLEKHYNTKLFRYEGKKLRLTGAGEILRNASLTMMHDEISMQSEMQKSEEADEIRFGATRTVGDTLMGGILEKYLREYPDAAITLSLGEKSYQAYKMFYEAGANRYLLRHETHNPHHYSLLHPETMSLQNRLQCLTNLKDIGYQTGTGIMVGSPGQTTDNIIEDILFIGKFKPQMIGIGPFIPHRDTPFADKSAGSIRTTLLLLSIFRLMHPHALIPSTTALASLAPDGRERGILAGANVVMPNLSPPQERSKYSLYNNKASMGAEAAEGLAFLEQKLSAIGYTIDYGRGDYVE